jgi:hypothetical protein
MQLSNGSTGGTVGNVTNLSANVQVNVKQAQ